MREGGADGGSSLDLDVGIDQGLGGSDGGGERVAALLGRVGGVVGGGEEHIILRTIDGQHARGIERHRIGDTVVVKVRVAPSAAQQRRQAIGRGHQVIDRRLVLGVGTDHAN